MIKNLDNLVSKPSNLPTLLAQPGRIFPNASTDNCGATLYESNPDNMEQHYVIKTVST